MTVQVIKLDPEITTCQHCGREHLKHTIECVVDGVKMYVGTTCVLRLMGIEPSRKNVTATEAVLKAVSMAHRLVEQGKTMSQVDDVIQRKTGFGVCKRQDGTYHIAGYTL